MEFVIPSIESVCTRLLALSTAQMHVLAKRSGVSFSSIDKIRRGFTPNPGVKTIDALLRHFEAAAEEAKGAPRRKKRKVKSAKAPRKVSK